MFVSGKEIAVSVGGSLIRTKKFSVRTFPTQNHDTTNSGSGGYFQSETSGVTKAEWSFEGDYDVGTVPLAVTPPGGIISNLLMFTSSISGSPFNFPLAKVDEMTVTGDVDSGAVKVSAKGTSHGVFAVPGN
jgi:hypothetical protein